jgi:lipoteichoic acid synthase
MIRQGDIMKRLRAFIETPYFMAILFAMKMLVYYTLIEVNRMQLILILISLAVWSVIFVCFGSSGLKRKRGIFILVYSLLSLVMFADTMYYNYYNQTVSIRQLWQAKSVTAVPDSFFATLIPASFLLFIDIPLVFINFKRYSEKFSKMVSSHKHNLKHVVYALTAIIVIMVINPFQSAAVARVKSMEFFTNHIGDICETIVDNIAPNEMEPEEILEVLNAEVEEADKPHYYGIGKGKNLVVIQLEAFQDFVIGAEYNGQEITPNLNSLINKDSIYFDRYYSNIGKGNTADAEFSSLNSLYPLIDGESYRLYEDNTYNGLPWIMREQGYTSFAVHGYKGEFWNRENAYPNQGFEDFISMEDLDQSELIGMGVSDKSMFAQLVPMLKDKDNPFFAFVITLTSHHPFNLEEEYSDLELLEEDVDTKFGNYLRSVHYTDEAIGQFIEGLKEAGLYDNTVIAMYGDHHGLNCGMDDVCPRVSSFIGRNYDYDEMLNVPLIIHVPGCDIRNTIHRTGGQIDFMPTIINIMGIEPKDDTFVLGQDIVNAKEGFVAFTSYLFEGSFAADEVMFEISREGIFEGSRAWLIGTNEEVDAADYKEQYEKALLLKKTSEEILQQNLIAEFIKHDEASGLETE